jgi:hypothetical protein
MLAIGRVKICGDYKSPLKNAAMTEATATVAAVIAAFFNGDL